MCYGALSKEEVSVENKSIYRLISGADSNKDQSYFYAN